MVYRCQRCSHKEARGCLPTVSCGIYLMGLVGMASAILAAVLPSVFPDGLGWWWLLAAPALLVLSVLLAFPLNWLLELLEWLAFYWRKCPQCGQRKWSWGFVEGWGL
jgi:hypothetical protein